MKLSNPLFTTILLSLLVANNVAAQQLSVRWGLDGPKMFYNERSATATQNASDWSRGDSDGRTFRYFTIVEPAYGNAIRPLFKRARKGYRDYVGTGGQRTRRAFLAYLRTHDRFVVDRFRGLAPRMFFDFMGSGQVEYVLTGITVKVLNFAEYKRGGFADDETSYGIVLVPRQGTYHYAIDRRLRFTGSGRTKLTFFSDNFYPGFGLGPMGAYILK